MRRFVLPLPKRRRSAAHHGQNVIESPVVCRKRNQRSRRVPDALRDLAYVDGAGGRTCARRRPVESADPLGRVFLANHEIELEGGVVQPIEYQGQTFEFSHRVRIADYSGATFDRLPCLRKNQMTYAARLIAGGTWRRDGRESEPPSMGRDTPSLGSCAMSRPRNRTS